MTFQLKTRSKSSLMSAILTKLRGSGWPISLFPKNYLVINSTGFIDRI